MYCIWKGEFSGKVVTTFQRYVGRTADPLYLKAYLSVLKKQMVLLAISRNTWCNKYLQARSGGTHL